ncbi:hypothetical protein BSKO_03729 [Bryopsis sp. KO-2023]|nr:hypothetical protein BSKO_03729 [Bryopsis sp. KO-2023]
METLHSSAARGLLAPSAPINSNLDEDLTILWLLLGAYLVFFMQAGFALLEAGTVRSKNTKNILLKNVLDACVGAIIWWALGYSLAFGEGGAKPNVFIGGRHFFMWKAEDVGVKFYGLWLFQWAFSATAATIVSGAVAERCQFRAYLTYTSIMTGFIYPVVVHWVWSGEGWLSAFRDPIVLDNSMGLVDFAGSGVVHMVGGGSALMASIFLGPRVGRFDSKGCPRTIPGHSVALATLGTFLLWFGWYGFNPVSTLCFYECMEVASKIAVTTTLAASAGGVTVLFVNAASGSPADVAPALNGILAGLVSITSGCSVVEPYAACLIGMVGGALYFGSSKLLLRYRIDDPLDATPVHFCCGLWGVLSVGFFATPANLVKAYGRKTDVGVFYGGQGDQLFVQILGAVAIGAWTITVSGLMFFVLKEVNWLRVPEQEEIQGLDISHHGGAAYDLEEVKSPLGVPSPKPLPSTPQTATSTYSRE